MLSSCQQCKNYHGQRYGENLLVCGMHPYGPGDEACEDFEKSDRTKWVVNIPSREFTSWGVTRFDLSCRNTETGVRVTFSLFAASEEDAVGIAQRILYGGGEERRNVMSFTVSYPPAEFQGHWAGRSSHYVDATDFGDHFQRQIPTYLHPDLPASQEWGDFVANADSPAALAILAIAEGLTAAFNPSSDTAPPISPEP